MGNGWDKFPRLFIKEDIDQYHRKPDAEYQPEMASSYKAGSTATVKVAAEAGPSMQPTTDSWDPEVTITQVVENLPSESSILTVQAQDPGSDKIPQAAEPPSSPELLECRQQRAQQDYLRGGKVHASQPRDTRD